MGRIANKILKDIEKIKQEKLIDLSEYKTSKEIGLQNANSINDPIDLIEKGYDPVHAAYVSTQNLISVFAEQISCHPAMKDYYKIMKKTEDFSYMPSAPPMSPITTSFYSFWAFFDVAFGKDKETIGGVFHNISSELDVHHDYCDLVQNLRRSHMGIYEHIGFDGNLVKLKELVTDKEYLVKNISGYLGAIGELWYVRLVQPITGFCDYHITLTTPYILILQTKEDWMNYFKRQGIEKQFLAHEKMLRRHMRMVKNDHFYWTEFVFEAYSNYRNDAIFLTGLPDKAKTRPHSKSYDQSQFAAQY